MNRFILIAAVTGLIACGSTTAETETPAIESTTPTKQVATATPVVQKSSPVTVPVKHNKWDGFYFRDAQMGLVVVIHDGKFYNFERKEFQSFYIDFKYDIGYTLNKDGRIPLVREYWLKRGEEAIKQTQLGDSEPIVENGETVAISYRVYDRLDKLKTFREYIENIAISVEDVIKTTKQKAPQLTDKQIQAALDDPKFVTKSKMLERKIRKEPIEFWEVIQNIVKAG